MPKYNKKRSVKTGLPPGSLIHIGDRSNEKVMIEVYDYSEQGYKEYIFNESELSYFKDLLKPEKNNIRWINVDGLNKIEVIRQLGENFNIHSLIMEDILNTTQRPKIEYYENCIYIVVLTIISTIFIPLTFLAGVYGMNFRYMPELSWKWGYGLVWLIMICTAITMILFFKKKKWF